MGGGALRRIPPSADPRLKVHLFTCRSKNKTLRRMFAPTGNQIR
jgi:hypothetical protein